MDNLLILIQTLGKNLDNEMTIRQLSIDTKVPYTTTLRTINGNKELFCLNKKGNIKLISLNRSDDLIKNYLIVSERYITEEYIKKYPQTRVLRKDLPEGKYSVILFGSRADETHREKSDIDLCIINKKGEKNIRFSKFELLFKLSVNPMYFSEDEFKIMLKEKEHNVGKEIVKKHIILYGEEYFWNLVWKNGI